MRRALPPECVRQQRMLWTHLEQGDRSLEALERDTRLAADVSRPRLLRQTTRATDAVFSLIRLSTRVHVTSLAYWPTGTRAPDASAYPEKCVVVKTASVPLFLPYKNALNVSVKLPVPSALMSFRPHSRYPAQMSG